MLSRCGLQRTHEANPMTVFVSSKERLSALRSQWPSVSSFTISP